MNILLYVAVALLLCGIGVTVYAVITNPIAKEWLSRNVDKGRGRK